MSELGVGDTLVKKYRIVDVVGEGGMATVFEGVHMRLGHKVAIKVLHADLLEKPDLLARFEREGRALCKVKSKHVVRVFDVDETPSGAPFMVMERLDGIDLEEELYKRGRLPIEEAVGYAAQACSAMAEVHALGIVHRDIKPANLFLTTEGGARILKVLDFGVALDGVATEASRLTHAEAMVGTPLYMAPEQFRTKPGESIDLRADIWSLGATLYEMLAGKAPFSGTASTIGLAVVHDPLPPIEERRPEVPAGLRAVLVRALAKEPADRFASMAELAHALAPFTGDRVVVMPRESSPNLGDTKPDFVRASTQASGGTQAPLERPRTSNRARYLVGIGIALAAALLFALTRPRRPVTPVDAPLPVVALTAPPAPSPVVSAPEQPAAVPATPPPPPKPQARPARSAAPAVSPKPSTAPTAPLFFPSQ